MDLTIETKKGSKGRSFSAYMLGWIDAPRFFEAGTNGKNTRPVWLSVLASEGESRPFCRNLQLGKVAASRVEKFELLKTAGYQVRHQRVPEGVISTFFLPDLFVINPGMVDPDQIKFIMLPDPHWLEQQSDPEGALALLFLAYLDRRCRFPMPPDVGFAQKLLHACLEEGLAHQNEDRYYPPPQYREHFPHLDLPGGVAFLSSHDRFGEVLSKLIQEWQNGKD